MQTKSSIDPTRLAQFLALAEIQHFGKTAERLDLHPAQLSRGIRRLEEEVGVALFRRTTRRVVLTEAGAVLMREARRILEDSERAIHLARRAGAGEFSRLRIGFLLGALFSGVLTRALRQFAQQWPDVQVGLEHLSGRVQIERLRRGELDAAFHSLFLADDLGKGALHVARQSFLAFLPPQWRGSSRSVKLHELRDQTFILLDDEAFRESVLAWCLRAGFRPKAIHRSPSGYSALALSASGFGVVLLPSDWATLGVEGVRAVPIADATSDMYWDLIMSWTPDSVSPPLRSFIEIVGRYVAKGDATGQ
jgi:DNA-binding transcriptional LysR family regulator